jgi:hypothetical protein
MKSLLHGNRVTPEQKKTRRALRQALQREVRLTGRIRLTATVPQMKAAARVLIDRYLVESKPKS